MLRQGQTKKQKNNEISYKHGLESEVDFHEKQHKIEERLFQIGSLSKSLDVFDKLGGQLNNRQAIAKLQSDKEGVVDMLETFLIACDTGDTKINAISLHSVVDGYKKRLEVKDLLQKNSITRVQRFQVTAGVPPQIQSQQILARLADGETVQGLASQIVSKTYNIPNGQKVNNIQSY